MKNMEYELMIKELKKKLKKKSRHFSYSSNKVDLNFDEREGAKVSQ